VLIVQGDPEEADSSGSAREFVRQLKLLGRPHKAIFYDEVTFLIDKHSDEVRSETLAWFKKFEHKAEKANVSSGAQ
jgi:hypothetical protein